MTQCPHASRARGHKPTQPSLFAIVMVTGRHGFHRNGLARVRSRLEFERE